ncbi:CatB-related O-acetyltransferase [Hyunsoonleella flava]|uniref:CatB-related O-acetyltransferase n=2 Tax=Hyunsoonleella flava TaxID=2527939 RepID=A0A4Q9FGV5_9FLAO|nr:CatB-related O-acetyltransferase [Hyunsoonleella flava]
MLKRLLKKLLKPFVNKNEKGTPSVFTKDILKNSKFHIGEYTYGKPSVLFENDDVNLTIGKFCSIAQNVTIFLGGNHRTDWVTTYPFSVLNSDFPKGKNISGHPATNGDVIIGNDVWIGRNATIMSGVKIGNGAVIGAGAVVTKNVGDYEVWAGNPSVFIKKRFDDRTIEYLLNLEWWHWDIAKINENLHLLCSTNIEVLKNS